MSKILALIAILALSGCAGKPLDRRCAARVCKFRPDQRTRARILVQNSHQHPLTTPVTAASITTPGMGQIVARGKFVMAFP